MTYIDQHATAHARFAAHQLTDSDPSTSFNNWSQEQLTQILASELGADRDMQTERLNAARSEGSASRSAAASGQRASISAAAKQQARQLEFERQKLAQENAQFEKSIAQQLELTRAAHALDWLKTGASLRGPTDWMQAANLFRNAPGAGTPAAFEALAKNQFLPQFGAQGGRPTAENMQTLQQKLLGGNPTGGTMDEGGLDRLATTIGESPHQLSPGSLESLTEPEMGMLSSLLESKGYSMPLVLSGYTRSRVDQGDSLAA